MLPRRRLDLAATLPHNPSAGWIGAGLGLGWDGSYGLSPLTGAAPPYPRSGVVLWAISCKSAVVGSVTYGGMLHRRRLDLAATLPHKPSAGWIGAGLGSVCNGSYGLSPFTGASLPYPRLCSLRIFCGRLQTVRLSADVRFCRYLSVLVRIKTKRTITVIALKAGKLSVNVRFCRICPLFATADHYAGVGAAESETVGHGVVKRHFAVIAYNIHIRKFRIEVFAVY